MCTVKHPIRWIQIHRLHCVITVSSLINRGRTDVHSGIYSDQLASQVDKSVCNPERVITCSRGEKKVIELQSNWKSARVLITCTSDALALMSLHWWGGHVRDCTLRVIQRCSFHSYILHSSFLQYKRYDPLLDKVQLNHRVVDQPVVKYSLQWNFDGLKHLHRRFVIRFVWSGLCFRVRLGWVL